MGVLTFGCFRQVLGSSSGDMLSRGNCQCPAPFIIITAILSGGLKAFLIWDGQLVSFPWWTGSFSLYLYSYKYSSFSFRLSIYLFLGSSFPGYQKGSRICILRKLGEMGREFRHANSGSGGQKEIKKWQGYEKVSCYQEWISNSFTKFSFQWLLLMIFSNR